MCDNHWIIQEAMVGTTSKAATSQLISFCSGHMLVQLSSYKEERQVYMALAMWFLFLGHGLFDLATGPRCLCLGKFLLTPGCPLGLLEVVGLGHLQLGGLHFGAALPGHGVVDGSTPSGGLFLESFAPMAFHTGHISGSLDSWVWPSRSKTGSLWWYMAKTTKTLAQEQTWSSPWPLEDLAATGHPGRPLWKDPCSGNLGPFGAGCVLGEHWQLGPWLLLTGQAVELAGAYCCTTAVEMHACTSHRALEKCNAKMASVDIELPWGLNISETLSCMSQCISISIYIYMEAFIME